MNTKVTVSNTPKVITVASGGSAGRLSSLTDVNLGSHGDGAYCSMILQLRLG